MPEDFMLSVENVSKKFCKNLRRALHYGLMDIASEFLGYSHDHSSLRRDEFWAVKDVTLRMKPGDGLAILGRNGAGKSTLMRMIAGRLRLDKGEIRVRGKVATIHELGSGFNMVQTGRENIYNASSIYGLSREQTDEIFEKIVEFSEIGSFIDTPVANYSSGMKARLGYAITAYLHPDLFIMDEVLAVGDVLFRKKCFDHLVNYREMGKSLIMATHDLNRIQSICNRCIIMDQGEIRFEGAVLDGINFFLDSLSLTKQDLLSMEALVEVKERVLKKDQSQKKEITKKHSASVKIEHFQLRPFSGMKIESGSPVEVTLDYHCKKKVARAAWGFSIYTSDLQRYIGGGFSGYDGHQFSLQKGSGRLKCMIPNLNFRSGKYQIRGVLVGNDGQQLAKFGSNSETSEFEVVGTEQSDIESREKKFEILWGPGILINE